MSDASAHIAAWEAAGLLDTATADRLRASEVDAAEEDGPVAEPASSGPVDRRRDVRTGRHGRRVLRLSRRCVPGRGVERVHGARCGHESPTPRSCSGSWPCLRAATFAALGLWLRGRSERASRGAGVAFLLVDVVCRRRGRGLRARRRHRLAGDRHRDGRDGAGDRGDPARSSTRRSSPRSPCSPGTPRWPRPASSGSRTAFFADTFAGTSGAAGPDPILLVVGSAVWWLGTAVVIGLIGLGEARAGDGTDDPAGLRRAAVCRFWAGLRRRDRAGHGGQQSGALPTGEYGRIVEPWIGILAMLILSGILLERAFRRDATSFMYAAALGLIVALTDLNVSYLSAGTEIALVLEGVILLAVGFAANALRGRVGRSDDSSRRPDPVRRSSSPATRRPRPRPVQRRRPMPP